MPDPCGDFHEYSMSSITAASRRWAERITIFLGQWLLCVVRLSIPLPPLACFHEYNVFLTSLSGQYRRPHPSPDLSGCVAAEHLIMAEWSILGDWMAKDDCSRKGGRWKEGRSFENICSFSWWYYTMGQEFPVLESSGMQDAQTPDSADSNLTYNHDEAASVSSCLQPHTPPQWMLLPTNHHVGHVVGRKAKFPLHWRKISGSKLGTEHTNIPV